MTAMDLVFNNVLVDGKILSQKRLNCNEESTFKNHTFTHPSPFQACNIFQYIYSWLNNLVLRVKTESNLKMLGSESIICPLREHF